MSVHRIASKISGAHRSVMLAAATSGPAAWLMGMLCVVSVIYHNSQLGGVYSPHAERQQYQYMAQLCSTPSLLGQLRCVASLQQQQLHQRGWMLGSVSWATVAAYPGDLGLAAAVFMPQLLLLLLVAKLLASWYARTLDPSGHANADDHDASGRVVGDSSTGHAAADASRPWAVRLLCGSGPTGAAAFLAVAKLLPLVCSFMTVITGWLGLRQQHPAAQALQLMHPATSVAAALMTLLSQADAASNLVISVLHSVLAGVLLACHQGLGLPGYYSPLQAWLALVLLDVVLPAAVAIWRQQQPTAVSQQSAKRAAVGTAAADGSTSSGGETGTSLRHRRSTKSAAAEPASPAAALIAAAGYADAPHSVRTSEETIQRPENAPAHSESSPTTAGAAHHAHAAPTAWDSPHLQPSTPSNSSDSAASPSRQHSASSATAADAALAAFTAAAPQATHAPQGAPTPTPTPTAALKAHQAPSGQQDTPVMDFEEALAACARGAAARQASGLSPTTALYHSQYTHHVVSIKASLDVALDGQELLQLVVNTIKATHATCAPTNPTPASSLAHDDPMGGPTAPPGHTTAHPLSHGTPAIHAGPLMLHPVAMRGCLHMLLPICFAHSHSTATAAASLASKQVGSCVLGTAAARALQQLLSPQQQQQHQQGATAAAAKHNWIQVDGGSPQLIVKGGDGSWVLQADSTAAAGAQGDSTTTATSTQVTNPSNEVPDGSAAFGNPTRTDAGTAPCWLEPPCVFSTAGRLPGPTSRPSTAAPQPTSPPRATTAGTAHVTVHGLPAAAGGLVRVLVVQGTQVVSDQLLHTAAAVKEPHCDEGADVDTLSVRLQLPEGPSLLPGPAMVCVLARPSSVAAAATAPAGVSPAVAAVVAQQANRHQDTTPNSSSSSTDSNDSNEELKAARMWACLPLLCVSTTQAHQELSTLFSDMCAAAGSASELATGDSTAGSSSSRVAPAAAMQHVQSFLWDCLYLTHGVAADRGLSCLPQIADKLKASASSTGPLVGSLYERATVWPLDTCSGSNDSSSSSSGTDSSGKDTSSSSDKGGAVPKQAMTAELLKVLVSRCMPSTIQQLQAAVAGNTAGTAAGPSTKSPTHSPNAASRRGSYDGSHMSAASLAANSVAVPPVHCKDAVSPVASLQQQGLQQQQQEIQFVPTSSAAAAPSMLPVAAAEAGFFSAHRRHSADGLPHPQGDLPQGPGLLPPQWSPTAAAFVPMSAAAAGHFPAAPSAQSAASAALFNAHRRMSMDSLPLPHMGYTGGQDLHPPRWSVDLPLPRPPLQQQAQQQQAYSISPTSLLGASLLNTTSPTGMAAAAGAGAGAASASYAAHMALQAWPPGAGMGPGMGPSSLLPVPDGAAAAAAAAGAAAAQAALLHMQSGGYGSQGANLQSPAVRGNLSAANAASSGSSSSRFAQQGSPMHPALAHMRSQGSMGSLGYSPSLASSLGNSTFMTADGFGALTGGVGTGGGVGGGVGGYGYTSGGGVGGYGPPTSGPGGRSPAVPPSSMQGAGRGAAAAAAAGGVGGSGQGDEYGSVEGRHWAVFDTTGVEGFDAGMETMTTNLATTRRNNTSSVTWLAIPTMASTSGLPSTGLQTPSTRRYSGSIHTSSTGKLRRSEQHHSYSSSLTPQPPRSQAFSHCTTGHAGGTSPDLSGGSPSSSSSSSSVGTIPMQHQPGRRTTARTMLFSPASDATTGSQYESCSPEGGSPAGCMGTGAAGSGSSSSSGLQSRHLGGFGTPQRPSPAGLAAASPRRGSLGLWSPGGPGHQLSTLPTIGSEDSWDQNAQATPSPRPLPAAGLASPYIKGPGVNQGLMQSPVPPLPSVAAGGAVFGTPGPSSSRGRGVLQTPRSSARPPVSATPRDIIYRDQTGSKTPGLYSSRPGNVVSGRNALGGAGGGGEGDTVSGVLQLLGQGEDESPRVANSNSGFSSDSSSLAGTPDGMYSIQQYNGGYFTPVKPQEGAAASLLPASACPASRAPAWATPAAMSGRNVLTIPPGMSGSFLAAATAASTTGYAAAAAASMGQQQVPDTPLLRAGRNIAGAIFSPAPPLPLSMQQGQQQRKLMSTPAHIQSLLPPPGSASKRKPAAALPGSAAPTGAASLSTVGTGGTMQTSSNSPAGSGVPEQSSAAAAAALLQLSPNNSSGDTGIYTPDAPDMSMVSVSGAMISSNSSCFDTAPLFTQPGGLTEADMHTPVQSPRAGGTPTGSPSAASGAWSATTGSGGFDSGSRLFARPPPAPARPMPGVVLVPAVEAESLMSDEGYGPDGYISEGYEDEFLEEEEGVYVM